MTVVAGDAARRATYFFGKERLKSSAAFRPVSSARRLEKKATAEGGVGHAIFAGLQMASQTSLKSRIRLGFDGDIVPTVKLFQ
jgi:hypothetical protein